MNQIRMNVQPVETLDNRTNEIRMATVEIVNNDVIPTEDKIWGVKRKGPLATDEERAEADELRRQIQNKTKAAGLWAPHLPKEYGGMGLDFIQHAYMNEIIAYGMDAAPLFGVIAPNAGNQKLLVAYANEEQKKKWLEPLVAGTIQSGYSMTEPDNAGSDPRSIQTTARRDGDEWVINGRKWFTTNGVKAEILIVMCRTEEPDDLGHANSQMTQIVVPKNTKGVKVVRNVPTWGNPGGDEAEIVYDNVRVPAENQLGTTGSGHRLAQERLGAGRIHQCMNAIGQMWRAFDMMVQRIASREVHGGLLETKQIMHDFIAQSFVDIQTSRLMTIHTAEAMDNGGDARTNISAIKTFVPSAYQRVVDRAIQVWGAAGMTNEMPFGSMLYIARVLRIADGPDEVHKILVAKNVLKNHHAGQGWDFTA